MPSFISKDKALSLATFGKMEKEVKNSNSKLLTESAPINMHTSTYVGERRSIHERFDLTSCFAFSLKATLQEVPKLITQYNNTNHNNQ